MPFLLLIVGIILIVAAYRGSVDSLFRLLVGDFTGPGSFLFWVAAILMIGSIGYIPGFRKLSITFLTLILVVLFLRNRGVFDQLTAAIRASASSTPQAADTSTTGAGTAAAPQESSPYNTAASTVFEKLLQEYTA